MCWSCCAASPLCDFAVLDVSLAVNLCINCKLQVFTFIICIYVCVTSTAQSRRLLEVGPLRLGRLPTERQHLLRLVPQRRRSAQLARCHQHLQPQLGTQVLLAFSVEVLAFPKNHANNLSLKIKFIEKKSKFWRFLGYYLVFIARLHTDVRYWYSNSVCLSVGLSVTFR